MNSSLIAFLRVFCFVFFFVVCVTGIVQAQYEKLDEMNYNKLVGLGLELFAKKKYEEALIYLQQAQKISKRESQDYVVTSMISGLCYFELREYNLAIELFEGVLPFLDVKNSLTIYALAALCKSYEESYQFIKTELIYKRIANIQKQNFGENHPDYASSINNLAAFYTSMGRYKEVEPLLKKAINIRKAHYGENNIDYATSLHNLAILYKSMGRYKEAEPLFKKVLTVFGDSLGKSHPDYGTSINNLGLLYSLMGRYGEAETFLKKAINIRKNALGENHLDYVASLNNLASLYASTEKYQDAELLLKKSVNIQKQITGENHPYYASSLDNLGSLYKFMKKYEVAEPSIRKARSIRKAIFGENHPSYITSLNNLGSLYQLMGRYKEAAPSFTKMLSISSIFLEKQYPSLGEKQQKQLLKTTYYNFEIFYSFVTNFKVSDSLALYIQDARLRIKGLSLHSSQNIRKIIQQDTNEELDYLYDEWQTKKLQLAKAYTVSIKERNNRGINLENWEQEANELERQLAAKSVPLAEQLKIKNTKVEFKDIKKELTENSAAIDFVHFDYHNDSIWTGIVLYYALVTRKDSKYPAYVRLGTAKEIVALLGQKVAVNSNNYINDIRKSHDLYQYLWLPLEPYLKGVHTIHLSPEGLLSKVAFETLVNNRASEERLMDQYQFRYYGTLKDFVLQARGIGQASPVKNKKTVLLGGALYDLDKTTLEQLGEVYPNKQSRTSGIGVTPDSVEVSEFNYLAGSQKEVEELASVLKKSGWQVDLLVGKGALEDKIKAIKGNEKPRILHLATHGYFFPKPEEEKQERILMSEDNIFQQRIQQHWHPLYRSGLALSGANHTWMGGTPPVNVEDGILTAYEVAMLDLYGTELVVLSACETGLGESSDTEGIYGLQRAFKQAGANKLIVSLWQVPDQQTQELMGYFYKNYLLRKSINESLEMAKATMRKIYSNPYYWAAFVLIE